MRTTQWDQRISFIKDIQGIRTDAFLKTLGRHPTYNEALAFSSNGEMMASTFEHEPLQCWDVATGALKWTIQCHDVGASAIVFSPDNRMLLLATCGNPMQERNTTQLRTEEAKSNDCQITYITLSPTNGVPEASRGNRMVRLRWPSLIIARQRDVAAFAFSSDCKTLASRLQTGLIQLWDTATGIYRQTIQGPDDEIQAIAVSPDGRKIASGSGQRLRLWDAATGAQLKEFDATTAAHLREFDFEMGLRYGKGIVRAITFCQDTSEKLLIAYGGDIGNNLWDPTMGTLVQTCVDKDDLIIAISPDNKILASAGSEVQLWDATIGMQEMDESNLATNASCIFAFTLDGKTAACAKSNMVQIWDTATGKCWRTIEDYWPEYTAQQRVTTPQIVEEDCTIYTAIAFSANGQALTLGAWHIMHLVPTESPCEIQVWDTLTGKCTCRRTTERNRVSTCAFSPDGNKLAVGFTRGIIMLLDIVTNRWLWKMERPGAFGPRCFAFFPDNSILASAHCHRSKAKNCEIDFWDTATGKHRQRFVVKIPKEKRYEHIMFSSDCRTLYIERRYKARLFQEDEKILGLDTDLPKAMRDKGVPVTDGWVTKNGRRLLWVPKEYRTGCAFVYGNTVVLGHRGGITFIWLDLVSDRRCNGK
jgi:WD40 repeat protein